MADPHEPLAFVDFLKWLAVGVLAMFQAFLAWTAKRQVERIDALEKTAATKKELADYKVENNATTTRIEALMKEHRDETRMHFGTVNSTLTEILLRLPMR